MLDLGQLVVLVRGGCEGRLGLPLLSELVEVGRAAFVVRDNNVLEKSGLGRHGKAFDEGAADCRSYSLPLQLLKLWKKA